MKKILGISVCLALILVFTTGCRDRRAVKAGIEFFKNGGKTAKKETTLFKSLNKVDNVANL